MKRLLQIAGIAILLAAAARAQVQVSGDQLGTHDLTPGSVGNVKGLISNACLYCHAPHGAMSSPTPLWNQKMTVQTYNMYGSTTYHQISAQPGINSSSRMCLSCHDGTVAVGQTVVWGQLTISGTMKSTSIFGSDLKSSHPFSVKTPLIDSPNINADLFATPPHTADPAVPLVNGNVECTSCHQPHFESIDKQLPQFLVRDSSSSQLCLACHDPTRVVNGQANQLAGWGTSIHAMATNTTSNKPYVGGYNTIAQNGCNGCHMPHSATGPARLLRGLDDQDCVSCHAGSNVDPAAPNIFSETVKTAHPIPDPQNPHDPSENTLLNNNRHATCVDCHNVHAARATVAFAAPPAIRASQAAVVGVSSVDGTTVLNPAVNQFENCFRCHGTSIGKGSTTVNFGYAPLRLVNAGDPLDIIAQFASTTTSSHPVTHDNSSVLPQPSLRTQMMMLDGTTPGRAVGVRVFCTDCHNSDDNREFGGSGPNGPHGSKYTHLLERRYEMTQAAVPGGPATNLFPNPDLTVAGPYALCAKCHDLAQVLSNSSFSLHSKHVSDDGFSCSVCHAPHGIAGSNANVTGDRLVNFDVNVVASNGGNPISYNRTAKTCTLACHSHSHNNSPY